MAVVVVVAVVAAVAAVVGLHASRNLDLMSSRAAEAVANQVQDHYQPTSGSLTEPCSARNVGAHAAKLHRGTQ